jgi:hypothetical protein
MTSHDTQHSADLRDDVVPPVERAIELALTLPFAIGARLVDSAPAGIEKARQQIVLARFVGKLAVDRGAREVRDRLGGTDTRTVEEASPKSESIDHANTDFEPEGEVKSPAAESLALPDYDQLPAAQVIAELPSLSQEEREALKTYEVAHRHRRTVLGTLAQLRSDEGGS